VPRVARPEKADEGWAASPRTRKAVRRELGVLAIELGLSSEEILDALVSPALGLEPARKVRLPIAVPPFSRS